MKNLILLAVLVFVSAEAFAMPTLSWKAPKTTALGTEESDKQEQNPDVEVLPDYVDKQPETQVQETPRENEGKRENGTANRVR